jgi:ATP-dependent Clp protease ATP-binding subunit ClpE
LKKIPHLHVVFQPVRVDEPTVEETIQILKGFRRNMKTIITLNIRDEAIEAAANLSNRYIQDRYLPDKAIDLLDEAGSSKNLTIDTVDPKVIKEKMDQAEAQKQQALKQEDYEKAAYYRDQVNKLEKMQNSDDKSTEETPS